MHVTFQSKLAGFRLQATAAILTSRTWVQTQLITRRGAITSFAVVDKEISQPIGNSLIYLLAKFQG